MLAEEAIDVCHLAAEAHGHNNELSSTLCDQALTSSRAWEVEQSDLLQTQLHHLEASAHDKVIAADAHHANYQSAVKACARLQQELNRCVQHDSNQC